MTLMNEVVSFLQSAQSGDCMVLSADGCCETRQGIRLACHRPEEGRRDFVVYCEGERPWPLRAGGAHDVVAMALHLAGRTDRRLRT